MKTMTWRAPDELFWAFKRLCTDRRRSQAEVLTEIITKMTDWKQNPPAPLSNELAADTEDQSTEF